MALAETAKDYARAARADTTRRAYESDWRHFSSWLRRQGLSARPPDPQTVGLYLAACAERGCARSVATLERRLSGIGWHSRELGETRDTGERHIATVLAGIRRRHGRPPVQTEAIFADDRLAMPATLDRDLRGLRDRAILGIGFAGALRRSEIPGLDCGPGQSKDAAGSIEILAEGAVLRIKGKTGWREVEIGRGVRPKARPVALVETWMRFGRIHHGPLVRRMAKRTLALAPSGLPTSMSQGSCKDARSQPGCGAILSKASASAPSAARRCAPGLRAACKWMKATCKRISATQAPK